MDALRPYAPADRAACLAIFDACTPRFFDPSERPAFTAWLDAPPPGADHLVIAREGDVLACGGWMREGEAAVLCWGMVAPALHRQGLGRRLTLARLAAMRRAPGVALLKLDTTPASRGFYAGLGFEVVAVTPDGYGPGLDRVDMTLRP
ncbi:GNAT family N-acetyltransferase [Albimonas pacifica]|uniref:Acetyltransferase (GNAT) domain-containing protein n=1 Tax=Albimonas pacifica TaxID=1114924 RepID=A0A1I3HZF4_9RHOB|nr:GNAT family N-acetyltransferase [Albimonas pacifica]SFI41084.1 Acetyltransferase (GNAT) domain-containing protein [Albimonas pacifica]